MAVGITPNERNEYVLLEDRDKEPGDPTRSVFRYRTLTPKERAALEDSMASVDQKTGNVRMNAGSAAHLALKAALEGWDDYLDQDGSPIPFHTEGKSISVLGKNIDPVSDETLARLHPSHSQEIATAIREGQRLTRDEVKN